MRKFLRLLLPVLLLGIVSTELLAATRPALLVVGTVSIPDLNVSDTMIKERLEAAGFEVTVVQAPSSVTADANGKAIVLVSATVASADVAAKFRNSPAPVLMWEQAVQDDFGMTGNAGTDHATLAGQTDLQIVDSAHPLAAGLSGVVTISNVPEPFSWGLPVAGAIKVAQIVDDPTKFPLYAYDAGAPMFGGFVAPAKRVMLPMGDITFESMTENGLRLFDAAVNWAALPISDVPTATISITSPTNTATLAANANATITVNAADPGGTIKRVEYLANDIKLGESTTAPFTFTWTNALTGRYTLVARLTDFRNRVITSEAVNVTVGTPPPQALLVVGTVSIPTLNASDAAIQRRLEQMGILVKVVQAPLSTTADATGMRLVLVSSTVGSADVAAKFRDVGVPVINWEQAVQDDFMMTANTDGVDRGTQGGLTDLEIADPAHPMAAGLSGVVNVVTNADTFSWGMPIEGTPALVAHFPGDPTRFGIYGFEKGEAMFTAFVAPERRVMLFMGDPTYANLTPDGQKLFDAAVKWTANITNDLPPLVSTASVSITSPAPGATFAENGNVVLTVSATDPNGPILRVEYLANGIEIGESTTTPFGFTWTNVATGRYSIIARATDRLGLTVQSAPINIVVGNPRPEILMVVGTVSNPTLNAADEAIRAKLESLGYNVRVMQAAASTTADATRKEMVVVSSTITSGDVAAKFRNVTIPVIMWEQAVQDDFGMTSLTDTTDRGTTTDQMDLEIINSTHPLAAGLSGVVTVTTVPEAFSWGLPLESAIEVAQLPGDPTRMPIYAYDTGAIMHDNFAAPARRVMLFMGDPTYENLTENGLKLVDAAFRWALNVSTNQGARFNPPTLQQNGMTLSWTGSGTLQQADSVTGPWSPAASQANPQTVPTSGTLMRFYRIVSQ